MKTIIRELGILLYGIIGWCVLIPLSCIIPKKRNLVVLLGGRKEGLFLGNIKYLHIHLEKKDLEYYFITQSRKEYHKIRKYYPNVLFYPSLQSIWILLRCRVAVMDIYNWVKAFRYFLLFRAKTIQLWHGVGFKRIQLDSPTWIENRKKFIPRFEAGIYALYPKYDLLISTSKFYTQELFSKAFKSSRIVEAGYSRNDLFFREITQNDLISTDTETLQRVRNAKANGYKIVLYAPTYRETGGDPISDKALDIPKFNDFARMNNLLLVFKFHTYTNTYSDTGEPLSNIVWYDNELDVYPLLPETDLLLTDYSSIYMDYLLLDKPILYFPYDYNKYISQDRAIQFDYNWITPGPKCYNQEELEQKLKQIIVQKEDDFEKERDRILNLAFNFKDGNASVRIHQEIMNLIESK